MRLCVSVANEGTGISTMNTKNGVEKPLADLIKAKAESEGLSINKSIKNLLEEYLGVKPQPERKNLRGFEDFCGLWTKDDLDEFEKKISDLDVRPWGIQSWHR